MALIRVAGLDLDEADLSLEHIRSSGPGGQNVNKVATAIQLRFDPHRLDAYVRERLGMLAGSRMTKDGILVIKAQRFRTQEANERDAMARLAELLGQAQERPTPRRATRPSRSARRERTDSKVLRGRIKVMRGRVSRDD
jgi:ribosome-associated protein